MDDDARRLELSPSLRQLGHPDLDPLFWLPERRGAFSAWWGHVPFAHWVMRAARPRVMVELGTHCGVSYAAFCQAVVRCQLNTRCFAVDTWKGDAHASFYDEGVYEDLKGFHDEHYAAFSTLLRCTFDEALERIEDGTVDLLHLDGLHTYDAVTRDFRNWLPKFSSRGVALLHDIDVHRDDFGVWQLWQELREQHPHFEFHHCYGLGVLALGEEPPDAIAELCALNGNVEGAALRARMALLGEHWIAEAHKRELRAELTRQQQAYVEAEARRSRAEAAMAEARAAAQAADAQRVRLDEALADTEKKLRAANAEAELRRASLDEYQCQNTAFARSLAEQRSTAETLREQNSALHEQNNALREQNREQNNALHEQNNSLQLFGHRLQAIETSTTWRATSRLRGIAGRLPQPVRRYLRRGAKAGYWALTPHKMPARLRFLRQRRRAQPPASARQGTASVSDDIAADYAGWIQRYDTITEDDRNAIRQAIGQLTDPPLISVVMPVYETPEKYLRAAIESVRIQLYPHWELCIADDASKSPHVRRVLDEYVAADRRIRICYRRENGHISEASNSALALATGSFVALLDHDDQLSEHALYMVAAALAEDPELDLIFSDEDKIDAKDRRYDPYFKSDWNPDLMLSQNMFSHLGIYRRSLIDAVGGFRAGYEGSQDYDLLLRASARTKPERIHHIPHILYHWRAIPGSVALRGEEKTYAAENARRAIADHLEKKGIAAAVTPSAVPHYHRVRYPVPSPAPLVSLIIPTTGKLDILRTCIAGILERTDYEPLELIIVPNNTGERREVFSYLEELARDPRVRIVPDSKSGFNFSRVCNIGIRQAQGELIGLVNDDLEVIDPDWLAEMVSHAVRPGIGAVGAMLRYPTGRIQHAGVIVGLGGVAGHAFLNRPRGDLGYFDRAAMLQNVSAVTGACLLMPMAAFLEVGELDEQDLGVAFNDIDLCLRLRERGYLIVWTPYAELYHHESVTRGSDLDPDKIERFQAEIDRMKRRWGATLQNDPYYNPNLRLEPPEYRLAFPPRVAKPWRRTETLPVRGEPGNAAGLSPLLAGTMATATRLRLQDPPRREAPQRDETIDIVVCVHNALDDVRQCLYSVLEKTKPPYRLIIVDDGSGQETRDYLADFAATNNAVLLRNEQAIGYTGAANCGLRASDASWVVLLNSDTIVTEPWLDAMWKHGWRDPKIGIIGPLSNTASWQSVPRISEGGDWARNPLPRGTTPQDMADLARGTSVGAREMPFLNGFCYMIRRTVINDIGIFDEEKFGNYGEENDYSIRTRQAGYRLAVATDAYVFHASSKSYSPERRRAHEDRANQALAAKHAPALHIESQVQYCANSPVFASVRARLGAGLRRRELIESGRRDFAGRRVAFVVPVTEFGGGLNVVVQEAEAMAAMGVDVTILNFAAFQEKLQQQGLPTGPRFTAFADEAALRRHLNEARPHYDAVIATYFASVFWLPQTHHPGTVFGYYIQDFEPRFFPETEPIRMAALATYTSRDDLKLFTKTLWTQLTVEHATGRVPVVVGCSVNLDLFAPAEERALAPAERPVRIAAMLRTASRYRAPARTIAVLEEVARRHPGRVSVHAFGTSDELLDSQGLNRPWLTNYGRLAPPQVAALFGHCDIFVDFSDYQAMGLSLLEAMVSGCAVVGPIAGGANSFLNHGINGLLADTTSIDDCIEKTAMLVADHDLRTRLQRAAIDEASIHVPEAAALNILNTLFARE